MRKIIATPKAPTPVAPYNQAIAVTDDILIYTAGQLGLDPATNQLVDGGVEEQTHQALKNIEQILLAAGSSMDEAVKVNIYLADMDDFGRVNEVYKQYFKSSYPARTAIQVARLPLDARIEIEAVACCGKK